MAALLVQRPAVKEFVEAEDAPTQRLPSTPTQNAPVDYEQPVVTDVPPRDEDVSAETAGRTATPLPPSPYAYSCRQI